MRRQLFLLTVIRIYYVINQLFEAGLMVLDRQTTYPMLMSMITMMVLKRVDGIILQKLYASDK